MTNFTEQELSELKVELDMLDEEFSEIDALFDGELFSFSDGDSSEELSALDQELEDSGLEELSSNGNNQLSLLDAIDGNIGEQSLEMQGWFNKIGNWLRNKARKIIRKIVKLVKRYGKLKGCVPAVTKAVSLFKSKKYARSLAAAYKAYRCIKKNL